MFSDRSVRVTLTIVFALGLLFYFKPATPNLTDQAGQAILKDLEAPSKADRSNYMFTMMRNPATMAIPRNIRSRELRHAAGIAADARFLNKTDRNQTFNWFAAGPFDVGGRTRALAIDRENSNRLLAGAVSGGVWESLDRGGTWHPAEMTDGNLSITYLAQDPRPGNTATWYASSGEFLGNSASDASRAATYFGSGIHKSIDGGKSWFVLSGGQAGDEVSFDSPFDFVNRIVVSPVTGSVFIASNAVGIYRSTNGGETFGTIAPGQRFPDPVLGGLNEHFWSDIAVNDQGVLLATLSSTRSANQATNTPGVYISRNDGDTWTNITPGTFPSTHSRSVLAFAPSNEEVAYVFTATQRTTNNREDVRLHKLDLGSGAATDLSDNIPGLSEAGNIDTQGGYNMAIAVKPDDEDFVLLGATNTYRSRNGFSSVLVDRLDYWVGGYDAVDDDFGNYANHHPDQHLFIFDPQDPNRMWNANDGGVFMTPNIARTNEVVWFDMNLGYKTTQFYTVAMPEIDGDTRIAGGTQDNGTPFVRLDDLANTSRNISVGDGAHLYFGEAFAFVGFQNGATLRLQYNSDGTPTFAGFSFIQPSQASNQLFVNPFVVDPNDEEVMYYPAGASLWRNDALSSIASGQTDNGGVLTGWNRLNNIPRLSGLTISAIAISRAPAHTLYFAGSDVRDTNPQAPRIYRLDNANLGDGDGTQTYTIPGASSGAYIADIAINPADADEIIVVLSNYEIIGLYHSTDGGENFTAIEGNLTGNTSEPGPSLRAATILPGSDGTTYFVGTSTGLYSTETLNGSNTIWSPEGTEELGNAVVWDVTSRQSDALVAVGTHGRGMYVGSQDPSFNPRPVPESFTLFPNYPNPFASITRIGYTLTERSRVSLAVFDLSGKKITDLVTNQEEETGRHEVVFNAGSVASGVYLFQLLVHPLEGSTSAASFSKTRKMMIIK